VSLGDLVRDLSERLAVTDGPERHNLASELAWCHVERGDLGKAFEVLWEPEEIPDPAHIRLLTRAELQAFCGNEDAALGLLTDTVGETPRASLVRARIAAARGDWQAALRWGEQPPESPGARARAASIVARARIGIEIEEETAGARGSVEELSSAAARARGEGASRAEADAWADLCECHRAIGDEEAARKAAVRAVELWDDMAMTLPPPLRAGFWCDLRRQKTRAAAKRAKPTSTSPAASGVRPLLGILRRLASERDLTKLLGLITDSAVSLSGAERGFVLLVDEAGKLEARTIRGAEDRLGKHTAAFSRSIAETVLIDREPVVTIDATHDARVQDYMSVHQLMLKSVACLPIEARGRTWGVLYLEHRSASGRFSGTDLSMLRAFADQAAIAIETADLLERIEAQKQDLERANEALREANVQLEQRLCGQEEALQRTRREIARLGGSSASGERWGLVGVSEGMAQVCEILERVAVNDVPVVITGESGTGKELVARAVHRASGRADAPYLSLNCGAIPEGLLESELFGHVAGAFTGATHAREGVFVQANGGTLFMDEIADMPPRMQLDLLRVLQERRVRPVGSAEEKPVDVRLVAASKRPLRELIDEGQLREDLYYRLAVVEIELPPLRARRADIPLLCDHFLARISNERGEPKKSLSRAAVRRLGAHDFPGNVRELEHLLINASVFATGGIIEAEDLAIETSATPLRTALDANNYRDFKDAERDRILAALNAHDWNRARAARSLGMARRTFYRRLKQHGIELPAGGG